MKGALGNIMKQAQQMQEEMQRVQDEIAKMEVSGESGGGMVKVTMLGNRDVKQIAIDQSLAGEELSMIADLVAAAVNDANRKVEAASKDKMSAVTSGLNLPPGFKMPF